MGVKPIIEAKLKDLILKGEPRSIDYYFYTRHSEVPAQRDKVITSRSNYLALLL